MAKTRNKTSKKRDRKRKKKNKIAFLRRPPFSIKAASHNPLPIMPSGRWLWLVLSIDVRYGQYGGLPCQEHVVSILLVHGENGSKRKASRLILWEIRWYSLILAQPSPARIEIIVIYRIWKIHFVWTLWVVADNSREFLPSPSPASQEQRWWW